MIVDLADEVQECLLRWLECGRCEITGDGGLKQVGRVALLQQSGAMTVGTVGALIACGEEGRDELLIRAAESTFAEEHGFGQLHHMFEKRWMRGEALEDAGNVRPTEALAKLCVECADFGRGGGFFDDREIRRPWIGAVQLRVLRDAVGAA